jgi:hypothetical protein
MSPSKPKWWLLFLLIAPVFLMFWDEARLAIPGSEHILFELGLLMLLYGIVFAWMWAS